MNSVVGNMACVLALGHCLRLPWKQLDFSGRGVLAEFQGFLWICVQIYCIRLFTYVKMNLFVMLGCLTKKQKTIVFVRLQIFFNEIDSSLDV